MDKHYLKIVENLRVFVDSIHLSDRAFERSVGWSNGFYGKVKAGRTSFSVDRAAKIFEVYPQLNVHWFFTGKGSMISEGVVNIEEISGRENTKLLSLLDEIYNNKVLEATVFAELKTEILLLMAENQSQKQKIETLLELQARALQKLEELFDR